MAIVPQDLEPTAVLDILPQCTLHNGNFADCGDFAAIKLFLIIL